MPDYFLHLRQQRKGAHLVLDAWRQQLRDRFELRESGELLLLTLPNRGNEAALSGHERAAACVQALTQCRVDGLLAEVFEASTAWLDADPSLMRFCKRKGFLRAHGPLHCLAEVRPIWRRLLTSARPPVDQLRSYFGESVALYFEWMHCYSCWLLPPALAGLLLWLVAFRSGVSVDNNPYLSLYAIGLSVWGFVFLKVWRRRETLLAHHWGHLGLVRQACDIRPEFRGQRRFSPVTGLPELHYPMWRRRLKQTCSWLATVAMLCVALGYTVCSLNLQGWVEPLHRFNYTNPFHIGPLAALAQPGALLERATWRGRATAVLHSVGVCLLNRQLFRRVASALTRWENYATVAEHESALVLKRYVLEAFDYYAAPLYLAFYELDVLALRSALFTLFVADCLRRLATELLIPCCLRLAQARARGLRYAAAKKSDGEGDGDDSGGDKALLAEAASDPYVQFDDYLEMCIQQGYILLFASSFPLASLLALLTNAVETRSDGYKLCFVTRRPVSPPGGERQASAWQAVLLAQTCLAALTNALIICVSSEQLAAWLPGLYEQLPAAQEATIRAGMGRYVVAAAFGIEHAILLAGALLHLSVSDLPLQVRNAIDRRLFLAETGGAAGGGAE